MSIKLGRIDYRLLHGIVATQWAPQSGAQRVMVIDDHTANDPIIKESMRLGKPAGMACSIITLETALTNFKAGKYDNHSVFVVAADPDIFLKLQEAGQKIPTLILGLTKSDEHATKVSNRASVREEEKPIYKKIIENGTEVLVKFVPGDKDLKLEHAMEL